jgi:hypothetical protein
MFTDKFMSFTETRTFQGDWCFRDWIIERSVRVPPWPVSLITRQVR